MFTYTERLIALRNLRPKRKLGFLKIISLFSFLGIMLGVAVLIIVMSVMNGFRSDLTEKIIGLNPHLIIKTNSTSVAQIKSSLKNENLNFIETLSGEGIVLTQNNAKGVIIKGVKKNEKKQSFINKKITKGSINDFLNGTIMIGAELAYNLNLNVGDKINLVSSSFISTPFGSIPKQENFNIAGIFDSGFYEFDQNLIYILISDAKSILNSSDDEIDLEIFLEDPFNAERYKKQIQKKDNEIAIFTWSDANKTFFNALKVERNVMFIILTLIIVVAAFNIISGLTILIRNKTKEIAIIRTLGLSKKSIIKSFFLTGFTIGLLATVSGIIFGIIFSFYIDNIRNFLSKIFSINIFPSDVYYLDKMPSELDFLSILFIFLMSLLITSITSYFPARTISKMKTTNALKYE